MNWEHLKTILWLRWRMSRNQWRRAGVFNAIVMMFIVVMALVSGGFAFFLGIAGGVFALADAEPDHLMIVWDVIIVVFLFAWLIGLVTELQRSELLSLDKLLHFPISLSGAFALNYTSSLFSLTLAVALPGMLGLSLGLVWNHGPRMLLLFPLLLAFVILVTGVTYQFRGWLATLMQDKRRRRTIIAAFTILIILLFQVPNAINMAFMGSRTRRATERNEARAATRIARVEELAKRLNEGEIDAKQHQELLSNLDEQLNKERKDARAEEAARLYHEAVRYLTIANQALPVAWLAYGARQAAAGSVWPGLLCTAGMSLIGVASLWQSYRSTMRFYTGVNTKPRRRRRADPEPTATPKLSRFLESRLRGAPEHVSCVAVASFRMLLRAPEAKMALVAPLIMLMIFGSMLLFGPIPEMPTVARPFLAIGALAMSMFGLAQLLINFFGWDRHGFRAYVLMPVARRDILVGKNLAVVPVAGGAVLLLLVPLQIFVPLSFTHFVAVLVQCVPAFLMFCLIGNMTSIMTPLAMAIGSMKPVQPKFIPALIQGFAAMLSPLCLAPGVLALVGETLLAETLQITFIPLFLLVSLVECFVVFFLYRFVVKSQGRLLQKRETRILETVTANVE